MKKKYLALLDKELTLLENATKIFNKSFKVCRQIGIKKNYSFDELDHFEALTSRFARLSDILIQKVLRLIDEMDLESPGTVRDRINRAEKKETISSAETFTKIRLLRNSISHEYLPETILDIFQNVLQLAPDLLDSVSRIQEYCQRYR